MDSRQIYDHVRTHYSTASLGTNAKYSETIAKAFGYSDDELATIPEGSNLGLSCGNPLAITSVRKGETIIDLGSGAGFDVFLAANMTGPTGKVIGVDMNKAMLDRANKIKSDTQTGNVEFVESHITDMSILDSEIADCIVSNCVVNLVPEEEKQLVFNEMFRLLKPGGRVALSDILAKKVLSEELRSDVAMYVGCIAGASMVSGYETYLKKAGFEAILITDTKSDINVYTQANEDDSKPPGCCGPSKIEKTGPSSAGTCCGPNGSSPGDPSASLSDIDLNEWVGSFKVYAVKN